MFTKSVLYSFSRDTKKKLGHPNHPNPCAFDDAVVAPLVLAAATVEHCLDSIGSLDLCSTLSKSTIACKTKLKPGGTNLVGK